MMTPGNTGLLIGLAAASLLVNGFSNATSDKKEGMIPAPIMHNEDNVFVCTSTALPDCCENNREASATQIDIDLIQYETKTFRYSETAYLNFTEDFTISFKNGFVTLHPYDISFKCANTTVFGKALVRYVQSLLEKAINGELSSEEKKNWMHLTSLFDYNRFRWDMAPLLYEEFTITSINTNSKIVYLLRTDGVKFKCPISLSPSFRNGRFAPNDRIGAFVRINYNGNIVSFADERRLCNMEASNNVIDEIQSI